MKKTSLKLATVFSGIGAIEHALHRMKIPYEFKKQCELPQFKGTTEENMRAGCFEFEYLDTIGSVRNFKYPLSPEMEGKMVFFPASLRHCVYPFFGTDEPRISIAGNLLLA